jgi:four helix bundle protein
MNEIRSFEDLECWKAARELRLFVVREVGNNLPKDEKFRLEDQLKRSARSVTANIAEGFGRFHFRDNYKFCSNARGSLFETLDHLITAADESFIENEILNQARKLFELARRLLNGYMNYLQRAAKNDSSSTLREDPPLSVLLAPCDHLIPLDDKP